MLTNINFYGICFTQLKLFLSDQNMQIMKSIFSSSGQQFQYFDLLYFSWSKSCKY